MESLGFTRIRDNWICQLVKYTFPTIINDLPDDVICNIVIYADNATHYSKCDQASHLWQQLELVSELESGLRRSRLEQKPFNCEFFLDRVLYALIIFCFFFM